MEDQASSIDWNDIIKKEARGTDDSDFGEVQEIGQNYVLTQRGTVKKERFYIPKYLVNGYDGNVLWFNTTGVDISQFSRESPPEYEEYAQRYKIANVASDIETRIPLIEERLDVKKRTRTDEATIVKEPITETKTVEVPVTREQARIERRPASEDMTTEVGSPAE
jgi:stress response protein YsnF